MAFASWTAPTVLTLAAGGAILLVGAVSDFKIRKFKNGLFLLCTVLAFLVSFLVEGLMGLEHSVLGLIAGFAFLLPLTLMGAIGAGDMKLLAAFGAACGWAAVGQVAIFGFAWGLVFGVTQALLKGQGLQVVRNAARIAATRSSQGIVLHRIPFAAALFIGWLTHLTYEGLL